MASLYKYLCWNGEVAHLNTVCFWTDYCMICQAKLLQNMQVFVLIILFFYTYPFPFLLRYVPFYLFLFQLELFVIFKYLCLYGSPLINLMTFSLIFRVLSFMKSEIYIVGSFLMIHFNTVAIRFYVLKLCIVIDVYCC